MDKTEKQGGDCPPERLEASIKFYVEASRAEREMVLTAGKEFGLQTIKTLLVLNGGALLALLALMGSLYGKGDSDLTKRIMIMGGELVPALRLFSVGALLSAVTAGVGYVNFALASEVYLNNADLMKWWQSTSDRTHPKWKGRFTTWSARLAVALAALSALCFAKGVWVVSHAFQALVS